MSTLVESLRQLQLITTESRPQEVVELLNLVEYHMSQESRRTIRASHYNSTQLLHKLIAWYTNAYQELSQRDSFQQAEFCSRHDAPIFAYARLTITVARQGYPQPVYSLSTDVLELLQNVVTHQSAPCFHFLYTLLTRLIADDQILYLLSTSIHDYLKTSANNLLIAVQQKIGFPVTATVLFLRQLLMRITHAHQQHNVAPLPGSYMAEWSDQQDVEKHYFSVARRLRPQSIGEDAQSAVAQVQPPAGTPDEAVQKQFNAIMGLARDYQQVAQLVYTACLLLRATCRHASSDLLTCLFAFIAQLNIRLLRFGLAPAAMLPFVAQARRARQEVSQVQQGDKKRMQELQQQAQRIPSPKTLQRARDGVQALASSLQQIAYRVFIFLNQIGQPRHFGQCAGILTTAINQAAYCVQLAVGLFGEQEYAGFADRLFLGNSEQFDYAIQFVLPVAGAQSVRQVFARTELFKAGQGHKGPARASRSFGQSQTSMVIQFCQAWSEESQMSGQDVFGILYGEDGGPAVLNQINQIATQFVTVLDEEYKAVERFQDFEEAFALARQILTQSSVHNYCLVQNSDNQAYMYQFLRLYQVSRDDAEAAVHIAELVSSYLAQFGVTRYSMTDALQLLLIMLLQYLQGQRITADMSDQLYAACKVIADPMLSGLLFDYRATSNGLTIGCYANSPSVTYDTCNMHGYTQQQVGQQHGITSVLASKLQQYGQNVVTSTMLNQQEHDIVRFEPKLVQACVMQVLSLVSQMLDSQYIGYHEQLQGGVFRIANTKQYPQLLNLLVVSAIKVIIPHFKLLDPAVVVNMGDTLVKLVQKLNLSNAISSCELILGLRGHKELLVRIQEQLLGQLVQFIASQPNNVDCITAFTICIMQSGNADRMYLDVLINKILYTSSSFLPYRVLCRYLFRDQSFLKRHDAQTIMLFDSSNYDMTVAKFVNAKSLAKRDVKVLFIIAKLMSLILEYDIENDLQQKAVYNLILSYLFDEKCGLLSFVSAKAFSNAPSALGTSDIAQDSESQLLIYLASVCNEPEDEQRIIKFANYYLVHLAGKFPVSLGYAVGPFLENTLVDTNRLCKELFYKYLMINSVRFTNARLFGYVFAHVVQSRSVPFVEYMLGRLERFDDQVDCNQLLTALNIKSYVVQMNCCRYLRRKDYYLDALTIGRVLKDNCTGYYDALVRRNRLLRELYDVDSVVYELALPLQVACHHVNLITPQLYVQLLIDLKTGNLVYNNYLSNVIRPETHSFVAVLPQLTVKIDVQHYMGVIDGDKDSNYYTTLDKRFYRDMRLVQSPVTRFAIACYADKQVVNLDCVRTLEDVSGLQMLISKDALSKNLPNVSIERAVRYLTQDTVLFKQYQGTAAPRYTSPITRCSMRQGQELRAFAPFYPIADFIPPYQRSVFVDMTNGFENYNIMDAAQVANGQGQKNYVDSDQWVDNLNYAQGRCSYTSLSAQLAIQTIMQHVMANKHQYKFNDDINTHLEPLVTLLDQFSLNYIKREATDTYRFFDLMSLASLGTIGLALRALHAIVKLFAFQMKDQSKFNILEQIYQRVSGALLSVLEAPDRQYDLITARGGVVQFWFNEKRHSPFRHSLKALNGDNKAIASGLLVTLCQNRCGTTTARLIVKACQQLFRLDCGVYIGSIFGLFGDHETPELLQAKLESMQDAGALDTVLQYAQYTVKGNAGREKACRFLTRLMDAPGSAQVLSGERFTAIITEVATADAMKDPRAVSLLQAYVDHVDLSQRYSDAQCTVLEKLYEESQTVEDDERSIAAFKAGLQKLLLCDERLSSRIEVAFQSLPIDEALVVYAQEAAHSGEVDQEKTEYVVDNVCKCSLGLEQLARQYYGKFVAYGAQAAAYIAKREAEWSAERVKQLVYCALLFGVEHIGPELEKAPFMLQTAEGAWDAAPQEPLEAPKEQVEEKHEDDGFGDFSDDGGFGDGFEAAPVVRYALNVELLTACAPTLLPLYSLLPGVAARILQAFLQSDASAEGCTAALPYLQTHSAVFGLGFGAAQVAERFAACADAVPEACYEAYAQLLGPYGAPELLEGLSPRAKEIVAAAAGGRYTRTGADEIGLAMRFLPG